MKCTFTPFYLVMVLGVQALFGATPQVQADKTGWPEFRGPGGAGVAAATGVPTQWGPNQNILWKISLPGPGTSTPIIYKDRIYLTCFTGYNPGSESAGGIDQLKRHLLCLSKADGKIIWSKEVPAEFPEQAKIRENHGYASSSPAVDDQRIYVFFGRSGVFAFDHDGKQLWKADVGTKIHGWGSAASPVLHENLVLINAGVESESLIALDKTSGKEVWRTGGIKESWNTPIIVSTAEGKKEIVLAIMGKVLGFDPASGKQLWSCATDIPWYMVPSIVAHEGVVYCIGGRGTGGALAVKTGGSGDVTKTHRVWKLAKGSNVTSPIYHEGHLYWMHENNGIAFCVEAKTGQVVYEEKIDRAGQVYASPILVDGKIYYVARNGRTMVVAAKPKFELLASNDAPDRSVFNASPAAEAGRLYLRSDRYLYCIGNR